MNQLTYLLSNVTCIIFDSLTDVDATHETICIQYITNHISSPFINQNQSDITETANASMSVWVHTMAVHDGADRKFKNKETNRKSKEWNSPLYDSCSAEKTVIQNEVCN